MKDHYISEETKCKLLKLGMDLTYIDPSTGYASITYSSNPMFGGYIDTCSRIPTYQETVDYLEKCVKDEMNVSNGIDFSSVTYSNVAELTENEDSVSIVLIDKNNRFISSNTIDIIIQEFIDLIKSERKKRNQDGLQHTEGIRRKASDEEDNVPHQTQSSCKGD